MNYFHNSLLFLKILNSQYTVYKPLNKLGIWGIAIAGAFVIGILSANPVVEAVGGWQGAFDGLDARITALENQPVPELQVYEVSADGIILQGGKLTSVELLCLDGDWVNEAEDGSFGHRIDVDDTIIFPPGAGVDTTAGDILEDEISSAFPNKVIGRVLFVQYIGVLAPFDIPFTVTILCLSPS